MRRDRTIGRCAFLDAHLARLARGERCGSGWGCPCWFRLAWMRLVRWNRRPLPACPWSLTAAGRVRIARRRMERRREGVAGGD